MANLNNNTTTLTILGGLDMLLGILDRSYNNAVRALKKTGHKTPSKKVLTELSSERAALDGTSSLAEAQALMDKIEAMLMNVNVAVATAIDNSFKLEK